MLAPGILRSAQQFRAGELQEAQSRLRYIYAHSPNQINVLINLSTIETYHGNYQNAIQHLSKATLIDPFDFRPYYNLFAIYSHKQDYQRSLSNFYKCLSLLYTLQIVYSLKQDPIPTLNRSIYFWQKNTASYSLKAIYLILANRLDQAMTVTREALEKCIMKHHIYAICCHIDTKMDREDERSKNARDYHLHLLKPLLIQQLHEVKNESQKKQKIDVLNNERQSTVSIASGMSQQQRQMICKLKIQQLINEFNQVFQECQTAFYSYYQQSKIMQEKRIQKEDTKNGAQEQARQSDTYSQIMKKKQKQKQQLPDVVFMKTRKSTTINIQNEISKLLGLCNLAVEQQQNQVLKETSGIKKQTNLINESQLQNSKQNSRQNQKQSQKYNQLEKQHINQQIISEIGQNKVEYQQKMITEKKNTQNQIAQNNQPSKQVEQIQQYAIKNQKIEVDQKETIKDGNQAIIKQEEEPKKEQQKKQRQQKKQLAPGTIMAKAAESAELVQKNKDHAIESLLYPVTHQSVQIKLIQADLQISQEQIGKLEPYVYYEYGYQKHKTKIAKRNNKNLKWQNQIKVFTLERNPSKMKISIYSREIFKWDELVGEATIDLIKTGRVLIPVFLKGKQTGEVIIIISKVI